MFLTGVNRFIFSLVYDTFILPSKIFDTLVPLALPKGTTCDVFGPLFFVSPDDVGGNDDGVTVTFDIESFIFDFKRSSPSFSSHFEPQ
mmetsp:Transcript_4704/g.7465  ORF Transcript_4704/g.7465 Transcript_4704/m.7465 type:complete len:88 (-) Transcript_4704:32-295(-)